MAFAHSPEQPDDFWRRKLTPEQYRVLREAGTEPPFSGALLHNKETGRYTCAGCGAELFRSDTKYGSGSGWPSFFAPVSGAAIELREDHSQGTVRTEARCATCGGHLGHLFNDPPSPEGFGGAGGRSPTGKRYCINSLALGFQPEP